MFSQWSMNRATVTSNTETLNSFYLSPALCLSFYEYLLSETLTRLYNKKIPHCLWAMANNWPKKKLRSIRRKNTISRNEKKKKTDRWKVVQTSEILEHKHFLHLPKVICIFYMLKKHIKIISVYWIYMNVFIWYV